MNVSEKLIKEARREGLDWDVYVMANLVAIGFSEKDAYCSVINKESTSPEAYDVARLRNIAKSPDYTAAVAKLSKKYSKRQQQNESLEEGENNIVGGSDTDDLIDKDAVAKELLRMARKMPVNSKERADVMMKYADLLQMKKDEVKDEGKLVHFYLPIGCYNCPLYEAHKLASKKK